MKKNNIAIFFERERYLFAILFAVIFIILGYLIPRIYYEFYDTTQYITVRQPVGADKKLYTCNETIIFVVERNSLIDTTVQGDYELLLVKLNEGSKDPQYIVVNSYKNEFVVNKGSKTLIQEYPLKCDLPKGTYLLRGIYRYKFHQVDHFYPVSTDVFTLQE